MADNDKHVSDYTLACCMKLVDNLTCNTSIIVMNQEALDSKGGRWIVNAVRFEAPTPATGEGEVVQ